MQKLKQFNSLTEVHLAKNYLQSNGVHSEVVGVKEYASHVLGGDEGRYDLLVEDEVLGKANDLLELLEKNAEPRSPESTAQNHFKKAVFFAIGAVLILPLVFNYVSLKNLSLYRQYEANESKKLWATLIVMILQIPTLILWWKIAKDFL